jgi:uncharacterized RDD family membrane protein YckC
VSQLVTGDAVLLDLRPARVPTRMLSAMIDVTLVLLVGTLWQYVVQQVGGSTARQQAVTLVGILLVMFGYPVGMETLTRGRTVGAYALGLRAVRDDGGALRFRQALLRGLCFWLLDFAIWTGFCGGLVCAAINPQGKRLGDLLAGTIVIRTRAPRGPRPLPPAPEDLAGWAESLELSRLSDELVTASRQLIQRYPGLARYPRTQLSTELARQVAQRIAPPPPRFLEPDVFLTTVITERRRRETERVRARQCVPTAAELPTGWR